MSVSDIHVSHSINRVSHWWMWALGASLFLTADVAGALFVDHYWVRALPFRIPVSMPIPSIVDGEVTLRMPNGNLLGMVGTYQDELTAYLHLQYLKSLKQLADREVLMTSMEQAAQPTFRLYVIMDNEVFKATRRLLELRGQGVIPRFALESPPTVQIENWKKQTALFEAAYHGPVVERLTHLPPE